jgi:putative tricarboxylic transport membrane protein
MPANRLIAVVVALLSLAYLYGAFQIPLFPIPRPIDSDAFPKLLGFIMLGLSVWLFFEKEGPAQEGGDEDDQTTTAWQRWQPVIVTSVAVAVYAGLLAWLGFVLASFLLTAGLTRYYGYGRHLVTAVVALLVPLGLYLVMTRLMNIHLPAGLLPF